MRAFSVLVVLLLIGLCQVEGFWISGRRRRRRRRRSTLPGPVAGNWSNWSSWSSCVTDPPHTCLQGTQTRSRTCSNPAPGTGGLPCAGDDSASRSCNPPGCPGGECGKQRELTKRVVGGNNAAAHEWPWQINLRGDGRHICGGTIISPKTIVTAAHCVDYDVNQPNLYRVRVGDHDKGQNETPQKDHRVTRIIVHPNWSRTGVRNDIAVLELTEPIQFDSVDYHVYPICLPDADVPVGTQCYITGWGRTVGGGSSAQILQEAIMPVISSSVCQSQSDKEIFLTITAGMICAGDGGQSNIGGCHGDSGGPYVCEINNQWELHGAVSWGHGSCSSAKMYTVFARVNFYRDWILSEMRKIEGIDD